MTTEHCEALTITPLPLGPLPEYPLVSVLIANYNYGAYLGQAIDSVLAQSYGCFEVIVCDDGSTDGSLDIANARARRDARVTVLHQENTGQARALCAAYQRSSGEIICLLDADDEYLPVKLECVVEAYVANPQVGFIADRVIRVDARGRQRGIFPLVATEGIEWCGPMLLRNGGLLRNLPPCSGLSLRRAVADEIFPLCSTARIYGDLVIRQVAPLITPLLRLSQPMTKYRLHGSNAYAGSRMTVPFLERELRFARIVWEVQRSYLASRYPALSDGLAPVDSELTFQLIRYMRARLTDASDVRQAYWDVVHHPAFQQEPWFLQWFWKGSIVLPGPVFREAIDVVMGAGRIKQIVALLTCRVT